MTEQFPQSTDASVLWALLEEASGGVWHWDVGRDVIQWSEALKTMLDRDHAPSSFEAVERITHPDDRDRFRKAIEHHLETRELYSVDVRFQKGDGEYLWTMARGTSVVDESREVVEMIGFLVDQTERVEAERRLQRSLERFRSFMDHCPAAVFIKNPDLTYLYINDATAELAGTTPEIMQRSTDPEVFPPETAAELNRIDRAVLEEGETRVWTGDLERMDGSVRWVQDTKFPVDLEDGRRGVGGFGVDLTEIRDARILVESRQRLESLGRLSGGIAHEFNNMLGVILGHAHMARKMAHGDEGLEEHVDEIIAAAERSANVAGQLLAFARQAPSHASVIDVRDTVRGLATMLGTLIGENISLTLEFGDRPAPVLIDRAQFDQVVTNLCVNARDAVDGQGTIAIGVDVVHVEDPDLPEDDVQPGDYVRTSVRDDGSGMSVEVQARVFEPFFTTKAAGEGTGLGLATVYGIVKRAGGWLEFDSAPGEGTEFRTFLPLAADRSTAPEVARSGPSRPGRELADATVLVVEDEPALLRLVTRLLEQLGCEVLAASTATKAEELFEAHEEVDVLLADVMMPGMDGTELARRLAASRPALRTLLMSGYSPEALIGSQAELGELDVLEKPFTIAQLAEALERVLRA